MFICQNSEGVHPSVEMLTGYMLICRNAEGVHGKEKVGNFCVRALY